MTEHPDLSPRAARTRAALLSAGFELLVEKPIDAIPIDDFVAKAQVAKGSFFNHFSDKQAFAEAIATEVRVDLEEQVARANARLTDPIERIAGGMRVCALFAITNPKRAALLLRSHATSTTRTHPLNKGLVCDFEAAYAQGLLRPEAEHSGVLFWLGLCQALMTNLIERRLSGADAERRIDDMIVLGLMGLGVAQDHVTELVAKGADGSL
ncbi:TetR/AcrR family transcriptional regulator [Sphingorhabdus sp.]|uniref:TetR/AcrR family transcriptional regulator n=1 Tax=Sphingorhabdus sp. TaxID=1902408 RepID=UPI003593215D